MNYENKKILIDADSLCFTKPGDELEVAISKLEWKIKGLKKILLGATDFTFYLTQGKTFRNDIYPDYKKGRKKKADNVKELKKYLKENYNVKVEKGYEADDIISDDYRKDMVNCIICSIDKDVLNNLVGIHINLYNNEWITTTEDFAEEHFHIQTIKGDMIDNIPSILKGFGLVKLKTIKEESGLSYEEICKYICYKKDINYLNRYRMLYMGKSEDLVLEEYNFIKNDYLEQVLKTNKLGAKKKIKKSKLTKDSMAVGKYKHLTWEEVYHTDLSYVKWMISATKDNILKEMLMDIV